MIKLKSERQIKILREGGKILSGIIKELEKKIIPGAVPKEIDWLAENLIKKAGGKPAFKGYQPSFAKSPYPATICFSSNNIVVHGLPDNNLVQNGDIVSIDLGMEYKGLFTDMALTVGVGDISLEDRGLIKATKEALNRAIKVARAGSDLSDIGKAIESLARKRGFQVIKNLTGHGVGFKPHEEPAVYNFDYLGGKKIKMEPGLVIAIEPMLCAGSGEIIEFSDGSFSTKDKSLSAHFEHTIAITAKGPVVLTK